MRTARSMGIIAASILGVAVLAGCSSSQDSSEASFDGGQDTAAEDSGGEVNEESGRGDADSPDAVPGTDNRSLIVTGSLYITVEDPIEAADQAADIVQGAGGRVDARDETAPEGTDGGSASLRLRIPNDDLDPVVDDLRALGTVDQFATETRDVTAEVTDLDAKISTLRASTTRIQGLLTDAADIEDIIALEDELAGRQADLESLEAQQRGLEDQVSMSTIDLSLTTEPVVIVEEESPQTFTDGLGSGWDALVAFVSGALVVLGVLLPWLALIGVMVLGVMAGIRARRSRGERSTPRPSSPATSATETAPASAGETEPRAPRD